MAMHSRASICSELRMMPISAVIADPAPNFVEFFDGYGLWMMGAAIVARRHALARGDTATVDKVDQVLAQVISDAGLRQLHCAETEKYPHVTYFFNGGREEPYPGEDRVIVPSPQVATYDLQPEMSAAKVADQLIKAIESGSYDFIVTNFANTDMVGHTARQEPVIRAVETLDQESQRVFRVALERGWRIMLTSDHGNCDEMINPNTGEPHTQHSEFPVPFLLMGQGPVRLGIGRGLADIAPTVLDLLGLPRPPAMTGRSLILRQGLR